MHPGYPLQRHLEQVVVGAELKQKDNKVCMQLVQYFINLVSLLPYAFSLL